MGVYVEGAATAGVGELGASFWSGFKRAAKFAASPAGAAAQVAAKRLTQDVQKSAALAKKLQIEEIRRLPADKRGGLFFKALGDRLTSKRSPAHIWITTLPFHDTMAGDILAYGKKLSKAERRKLLSILHDVAAKLDDKKKPRARDEMLLIWRFVESIWSRI